MILVLKLLLAPLLIYVVTLAGRRWGPTVSGFLIGLPPSEVQRLLQPTLVHVAIED